MRKDQGFTLLELMLVMAVISVLAIVTVPKYDALKNQYRLEAAAQKIISELGFAKQYALDHRKTITINLTDTEVQVLEDGNLLDSKPFEAGVKFDSSHISNEWLGSIRDASNQIIGKGLSFDNRGFNSLSGMIILTHASGRIVGIRIEDKTGYLSIIWP